MELLVIEVLGVPQVLPHERMGDQLKIHFQKQRNSGGDVLTVIYPTSTPCQAYVIFESAIVSGVLECTHILDVNNKFYPVLVTKANLSEVDMPVETTLHLRMFPKQESVRELLKSYDFTVTEDFPGRLQLKGSFLNLKLIRCQLIQLLGHKHHHSRPSSDLQNGSPLRYEVKRYHSESRCVSQSISRSMHAMDAVGQHQLPESARSSLSYQVSGSGFPRPERNASSRVDAVQKYQMQERNEDFPSRWNSSADGASSLSANDPCSLNLLQHLSPSFRDSASGGSPRDLHIPRYFSTGSYAAYIMQHHTSHEDSDSDISPSSSSGGISSFQVDTDIINFIQTQQQNDLKTIKKDCGTEMVVQGDAEIATVTLHGKNSEKAKACLLKLIRELSFVLRSQEINLEKYDHAKQMQILERVQRNQDSSVIITRRNDVIKLVGSSRESFEMMQRILGHKDDLQRGRDMERGSKVRRSLSLPRHYKIKHHSCVTDPEPQASGTTRYNPARYQEKPDEGKPPQIGRGSERTLNDVDRQDKNVHQRVQQREQRVPQDLDLTVSSPRKKSQKNRLQKFLDSGIPLLAHKRKDFTTKKQNKD